VDSDGLLKIDIIRSDGSMYSVAPLELGEETHSCEESTGELKELERRLAHLSVSLSTVQQERGAAILRMAKTLGEGEYYLEAFESLEKMISEMERVVR